MSFMCLRDFLSDLSLCAPPPTVYWKDCSDYVYMLTLNTVQ